ncbi:MAG: tetratricopeptide repeat protein [bacterium]
MYVVFRNVVFPLLAALLCTIVNHQSSLAQAEEISPESFQLRDELFDLYWNEEYETSLELLDRLQQEFPDDKELQYFRAMALYGLGRWEEAIDAFHRRQQTANDDIGVCYLLLELGDLESLRTPFVSSYRDTSYDLSLIKEIDADESLPQLSALMDSARQAVPDSLVPWLLETMYFPEKEADADWRTGRLAVLRIGAEPANFAQMAVEALRTGNPESAREICHAGLDMFPDDPLILEQLVQVHWSTGEDLQAHDLLLDLVGIMPEDTSVHLMLGFSHEDRGELQKALVQFRLANELSEGGWPVNVARMQNELGMHDQVLAEYQPPPDDFSWENMLWDEYKPEYWYEVGRAFEAVGDLEAAAERYEYAEDDAYYYPVALALAGVLQKLGRHEDALAKLEDSYEYLHQMDARGCMVAAEAYLALDFQEDAVREAYFATQSDPDNAQYVARYAELLALVEPADLPELEQMWRWDWEFTTEVRYPFDMAMGYISASDVRRDIQAARSRYPGNPLLAFGWAAILDDTGNNGSARRALESALDTLDGGYEQIADMIGMLKLLLDVGEQPAQDLVSQLEYFLQKYPDEQMPITSAYLLYGALDEYALGEEYARKALEIDPQDVDAMNSLAAYLYRQDRADEGVAIAQQAMALDPGNAETHMMYLYNAIAAGQLARMLEDFSGLEDWQHSVASELCKHYHGLLVSEGEDAAHAYLKQQMADARDKLDHELLVPVTLLVQKDSGVVFLGKDNRPEDLDYLLGAEEALAFVETFQLMARNGGKSEEDFLAWQELHSRYPDNPLVLLTFTGVSRNTDHDEIANEILAQCMAKYPGIQEEIGTAVHGESDRQAIADAMFDVFQRYLEATLSAYPDQPESFLALGRFCLLSGRGERTQKLVNRMERDSVHTEAMRELRRLLAEF